jgi:hypothetical protein
VVSPSPSEKASRPREPGRLVHDPAYEPRETPDALQGFHECFFLNDEGSAVPDEVFRVARGAMGEPGSMGLMTGCMLIAAECSCSARWLRVGS